MDRDTRFPDGDRTAADTRVEVVMILVAVVFATVGYCAARLPSFPDAPARPAPAASTVRLAGMGGR